MIEGFMPEDHDQIIEIKIQDQEEQIEKSSSAPLGAPNDIEAATVEKSEIKVDYYDQLLRTQAEFLNYKRRTEQRLQEWKAIAGRDILAQLLPVIDDFDILFAQRPDGEERSVLHGVKLIHSKFMATLKDLGLTIIDPLHEEFNPNIHDAVLTEESDSVKEGKIVRVWQKGFFYNDTLLRPAKVITARAKKTADGEFHGE
jgi:molecular chaperone GrpE